MAIGYFKSILLNNLPTVLGHTYYYEFNLIIALRSFSLPLEIDQE